MVNQTYLSTTKYWNMIPSSISGNTHVRLPCADEFQYKSNTIVSARHQADSVTKFLKPAMLFEFSIRSCMHITYLYGSI